MSKTFIKALVAALAVVMLQGCGLTGGVRGQEAASAEAAATASAPLEGTSAEGAAAAVGKPAPPAPEVEGHNAELFQRATDLAEDGRLVEAEALLLEVTSDQPELAGPWFNLGRIYLAQKRDDEALGALQKAVHANPANCAARTELGVLLRRRGDFASAESQYLGCLEYRPDYRPAYLNLGILYDLYLGRLTDALVAYRRYQDLGTEPDRKVNGWVVDLERRLGS